MEGNETLASLFSEGTESSGGDGGGSEALSGGSGVIESGGYRVAKFDFAHISTPYVICMWILLASAMKVGYHHLHMSKVLPESCILILFGILLGFACYEIEVETSPAGSSLRKALVEKDASFSLDSKTFFFYLLPPIVLDAGYFMPNRAFFDNLGTILLYAVVGTLFNIFAVGFSLFAMMQLGALSMPAGTELLQLLIFATVVSAVDPVAVLAVFEEISVNQVLHIIVFGESLLNDAVTVVLYHMLEDFSTMSGVPTPGDVAKGLLSFVVVALGGAAVGVISGVLTALLTKFTAKVRLVEPLFIFGMAYFSYLVAELFHLSGIMAIVFCGITMKQYVEANISQKSHTTVKYFLKMTSNASETVIFALLGISTLDVHHHEWNGSFVFFTLVFCLVFRFVGVVILTWFANRKRVAKMDRVSQFVMGYGGIRGAVTYSLVVLLDGRHVKGRNMMVTAAIALILFTCFIQGVTIKPFVELLKVKKASKKKPTLTEQMTAKMTDHLMAGVEDIAGFTGHHYLRDKFEYLDGKYLRPILMREPPLTQSSAILDTFTKLNLKDAVDRVVAPPPAYRDLTVAPVLMATSPPLVDDAEEEANFPRVTDRYAGGGEGEGGGGEGRGGAAGERMDENAMHRILEDHVFAPRQFAVYKRADIADDESVMGLDELKDVAQRRESTAATTAAASAATAATASPRTLSRPDGDFTPISPHHHRLDDINEHRSGRIHHHRHHHHRHHHSSNNENGGNRGVRRRRGNGDHVDRSPPNSLADDSPHSEGHSSQHSDHHHHQSDHHYQHHQPSDGHHQHHHHHQQQHGDHHQASDPHHHHHHRSDHRHHHHHHHHGHHGSGGGGASSARPGHVAASSLAADNDNHTAADSADLAGLPSSETAAARAASSPSFHLYHDDNDDDDGDEEDCKEEEEQIEDSVIPDLLSKEDSDRPLSGRQRQSAYELPTVGEVEERRRRMSSHANDDMLVGKTATETTLPWRKDDDLNSDQAAKSAIVFRSRSHSTLHQLAAAAEDSNEPSLEPRPTLSRPSSSHHLSSLVEDGNGLGSGVGVSGGVNGGGCGGSNSATAATSEAEASVSTPPEGSFSLHHNDPIYGRHRGAHGSHRLHHEMSLQECQMALDVAVDEAEEEAASPEDRAHLHHTADPKLMRKRGELFEWSQRHKAPKQSQEVEEENPFDRVRSWLQFQEEQPEGDLVDCIDGPFLPAEREDNDECCVDGDELNAEDDDDEEDTARIEAMMRSADVSDVDDDEDDGVDVDTGSKEWII